MKPHLWQHQFANSSDFWLYSLALFAGHHTLVTFCGFSLVPSKEENYPHHAERGMVAYSSALSKNPVLQWKGVLLRW